MRVWALVGLLVACGSDVKGDDTGLATTPATGTGAGAGTGGTDGAGTGGAGTATGGSGTATGGTATGTGTGSTATGTGTGSTGTGTGTGSTGTGTGSTPVSSPGCGLAPAHPTGGATVELDAGADGDGRRSFWLTLPAGYDPSVPHRVVVAYAGTDWIGEWMVDYLRLEREPADAVPEIFVYPDPLWRYFPAWGGTYGGWVLGPHGGPAEGMGDLVFTERLLDWVADHYCVDTERQFATGHSWGGDMAMVASCFLGDRLTASVPVAANEPYWFHDGAGYITCTGDTAVWTMFGIADDHFTWQDYPGEFGDACTEFWMDDRACGGPASDLPYGVAGECVAFEGCEADVRYCLYGAEFGHQIPDYYPAATMDWFRTF